MSKRYNIRWRPDDDAELRKAVKNFNAKITRLENKGFKKSALPERITVKQIKEVVQVRQDLKREMDSLRRFTQRGAEELVFVPDNDYNLQATKWQIDDMKRRTSVINRRRKKMLKDIQNIEVTAGGENTGYKRGDIGMGKQDEVTLRPFQPFTPKMNKKDFDYKLKHLRKESSVAFFDEKKERLRQNYIKGILASYNENDPRIKDVIEKIEEMSFEEFYKTFQAEDPTFEFASDLPDDVNMDAYIERLKTTWAPKIKPKRGKK